MSTHDAIVIGSGHNGLTCACYLAKAGLKVLVLEQYRSIGGMTNTEELTLPGFKSDTHAIRYQLANLSPAPKELDLAGHGLELIYPAPNFCHLYPEGSAVSVWRNIEETDASICNVSRADADKWMSLYDQFLQTKDEIAGSVNSMPLSIAEQAEQLRKTPAGMDQYRFQLQSCHSWVDENFESDEIKALLTSWGAHVGAAPDDGGSAPFLYLFSMIIQHYGNNMARGVMRNLPVALASYLEAHGCEIKTNASVKRIVVESNRATAVELATGESIDVGSLVASNIDPMQLVLGLLGSDAVGNMIHEKISRLELGPSNLVIYLALDSPLNYHAGQEANQTLYGHPTPVSIDYFAEAFRLCRNHHLPATPFTLLCNDSADSSRVPDGRALMKIVVQPVPYLIRGDATGKISGRTWEEASEPYADHIIDHLTANYVADLRDKIIARVVHSPIDIEHLLPSSRHGTVTHGAVVPYQSGSMRPIPELGQYRCPIENVYLCGSGSHPGPGVSMAPGRNAAQVIYQDLDVPFVAERCPT